jgi:hypothetical protein
MFILTGIGALCHFRDALKRRLSGSFEQLQGLAIGDLAVEVFPVLRAVYEPVSE